MPQASSHGTSAEEIARLEGVLLRIGQLSEVNPMMGHRGCRLGITYPEIIAMQVGTNGIEAEPEIMIPLVSCVEEIRYLRNAIEIAAKEVFQQQGKTIPYRLGAMIELPRAAMCAASIAREMDFLSFGTNDLTQMTYGFSRDDARKFIDAYLELGILQDDPFVTLDQEGVGALIALAIREARGAKKSIKIGVCGEHGGDPARSNSSTPSAWILSPALRRAFRWRSWRWRKLRSDTLYRGRPFAVASQSPFK